MNWTTQWSNGGVILQYPGKRTKFYPHLAQNQGNVYFAGDHLSAIPLFIAAGALDSSKFTVEQIIQRQINKDMIIDYFKFAYKWV